MGLTCTLTGGTSATVADGRTLVAEVRDLRLCFMVFRPGGEPLIGETYPVPLYWRQYHNHQDPERHAGSDGRIRLLESTPSDVRLLCTASTASGSVSSRVELRVFRIPDPVRYFFRCSARLEVLPGHEWEVTHNPGHGEVEFCNLWPDRSFVPDGVKRYTACCLLSPTFVQRIPHHHMESSDKHNLRMTAGDRFLWTLEDENLCLEMLSSNSVTAGVCAYMWDAHFAYSVCSDGRDRMLPPGTRLEADFTVSALTRDEAGSLTRGAVEFPDPAAADTPVVVGGVHTFRETFGGLSGDPARAWPWEREVSQEKPADIHFALDRTRGYDDTSSLRISSTKCGAGAWRAAAYGPAYGGPPFGPGRRYRVSAMVSTRLAEGNASLALRLHLPGRGDLYRPETYSFYPSPGVLSEGGKWERLEVTTPPIPEAPDRLHVLLRHDGIGTSWYDNVFLEVLP